MSEFLFKAVGEGEDLSYVPTTVCYCILCALLVVILLLTLRISSGGKRTPMNPRQLVFCSISLCLAFVTGTYCKLFHMPMGGSMTLFSMFFITVTGYWYGLSVSLPVGLAYGILQLVTGPYIISVPQLMCDYILAYGALGLSGIFHNKKHGLVLGYITGVTGRLLFSFLSGFIFFGIYGNEYGMNAVLYSLLYNAGYIYGEGLLTTVVLLLPPVRAALGKIRILATERS